MDALIWAAFGLLGALALYGLICMPTWMRCQAAAVVPNVPPPAPVTKPHRCDIVITLRQAKELLDFFGGSDCEVTVMHRNAGEVKDEDDSDEILPAGLYAYCTDCPEEGCIYLGPTEVQE